MAEGSNVKYDLVIVTDATGSMHQYLGALRTSLPQILGLSRLTDAFEDIAILAYRDYCEQSTIDWSGWLSSPEVDLPKFASSLTATGGGDLPEAAKTAIYELSTHLHEGRKTLIIWYTDAPPHHVATLSNGGNREKEVASLESKGEVGKSCVDWVSACRLLAKLDCEVITVLQSHYQRYDCFYALLGHLTRGGVLSCGGDIAGNSRLLSQLTIDFLLGWMGMKGRGDNEGDAEDSFQGKTCKKVTFKNEDLIYIEMMTDENSNCQGIFPQHEENGVVKHEVTYREIQPCIQTLAEGVQHSENPIHNLSKRFVAEDSYRKVVYRELKTLIEEDVTAISLNAVFGDLWRVVCRQGQADERTEVVNAFSRSIAKLQDPTNKEIMTKWLAESYDQAADINELLDSVEEEDRYPAVCIDPTMCGEEIMEWRRDELLEIGRSCQPEVLKRLGRILNKLVFLPSKQEVPSHIANDKDVTRLPLSLATKKNRRKFWTVMLHLVMPGTLLGSRAGALLAALSLRIEVPFLQAEARECMRAWRGRWADLEVGENWSMGCLHLLTVVDEMERRRQNVVKEVGEDEGHGFLTKFERSLFKRLYYYRLTELNIGTALTARVPFTPNKTYGYLAKTVHCKSCDVDRSVTMMSSDNICGICVVPDEDPAERLIRITTRTDTSAGEKSKACWVECAVGTCRAQYVVYNVDKLNVRAKCWYCRQDGKQGESPWIECVCCLNRVIWPNEYRGSEVDTKNFRCGFCVEDRQTTVEETVTAKVLMAENSKKWVLGENGAELDGLLTGRSIYGTVKAHSMEVMETIEVLPKSDKTQLVYKWKPVRNSEEVKDELRSWVFGGRVEKGTCTLCFESFRKADLLPACGRRGCNQVVDRQCLKGWYGMNCAGAVLNIMALHCPFCRRAPTGKTLEKHGMGVSAVCGLAEAVREQGQWIFGWCKQCGFAKKILERVCSHRGPPELKGWKCDSCASFVLVDAKECPGCQTMTERKGGCNHIACPVENCNTHWCFVCRYVGDRDDPQAKVYEHMSEEHGGCYFGGDAEHQLENDIDDEED